MKHFPFLVAWCLTATFSVILMGCVTLETSDAAIRQHFQKTCLAIEATHTVIQGIHSLRPLPANVINPELAAYVEAADYCAHPETASTVVVLEKLIKLSLAIVRALNEAKKVEDVLSSNVPE